MGALAAKLKEKMALLCLFLDAGRVGLRGVHGLFLCGVTSAFALRATAGRVSLFRRMAPAVDGLEFLDADVGVNGGGFELGVSEELLDVADVRAAFEHVGGAGMAEQMRAAVAADVGLFRRRPSPTLPQPLRLLPPQSRPRPRQDRQLQSNRIPIPCELASDYPLSFIPYHLSVPSPRKRAKATEEAA